VRSAQLRVDLRLHLHQRRGCVRDPRSVVEAVHVRRRIDERSPHVLDLAHDSHPLAQLQGPPEAQLQATRHARVAGVPRRPAHSLVEQQRSDAAVGHSRPTLKSIGDDELRHRPLRARHELQLQPVLIERPAPETVTVESNLHGGSIMAGRSV